MVQPAPAPGLRRDLRASARLRLSQGPSAAGRKMRRSQVAGGAWRAAISGGAALRRDRRRRVKLELHHVEACSMSRSPSSRKASPSWAMLALSGVSQSRRARRQTPRLQLRHRATAATPSSASPICRAPRRSGRASLSRAVGLVLADRHWPPTPPSPFAPDGPRTTRRCSRYRRARGSPAPSRAPAGG